MIRALIADDEEPARRKLRQLLGREADVEIVGEAADGVEAVAAIRASSPDVVFLDIQMPRLDGFGVVSEVGVEAMPAVVFVTAYDEHALRAFEVQAIDYLLKPFAPSRLARLLDRLRRQRAAPPPAGDLAERLASLVTALQPEPRYLQRILADRGAGRQALLAVATIDRIRADGNTLILYAAGAEHRRRGTLRELESRLDPDQFLRLNRAEIVRLDAIREIQPWFHGDARVVLHDGTVVTWSRRYRAQREL